MPRPVADAQYFADLYQVRCRNQNHAHIGQWFSYGREFATHFRDPDNDQISEYHHRVTQLLTIAPIEPGDTILVVGAGFGFLVEAFQYYGFPCMGVDDSPYVVDNYTQHVPGGITVALADVTSRRFGSLIRRYADKFDWVITESVLESYDDTEIPLVVNGAEEVSRKGVIHMVKDNPGMDSRFQYKTLEDWSMFYPTHYWVSSESWQVIHG